MNGIKNTTRTLPLYDSVFCFLYCSQLVVAINLVAYYSTDGISQTFTHSKVIQ